MDVYGFSVLDIQPKRENLLKKIETKGIVGEI